jgi:hypothetical protein
LDVSSGLVLKEGVLDRKLSPEDDLDVVGKVVLTPASTRTLVAKSINSSLIIPSFRLMTWTITSREGLEYSKLINILQQGFSMGFRGTLRFRERWLGVPREK